MFGFGTGSTKRLVAPTPQITPILASDLAFQLNDSNFWLESVVFEVFSRDGSLTTVSFAVASIPLNKNQVLFTIKWHDTNCKEHSFQNKYNIYDLDWRDSHCSVLMPDGSFIKYDEGTRKYTVRMTHDDIPKQEDGSTPGVINIEVIPTCDEGLKLGDGNFWYDGDERKQFWKLAWYPRCEVEASGMGTDMGGMGFMGRTITNVPIYNLSTKAAYFKLFTPTQMLNMLHITLPKAWGSETISVGAYIENGHILAATTDNKVVVNDAAEVDPVSGYCPPVRYTFVWKGQTIDGTPFEAKSEIFPTRLVNRLNVLASVPQPLRWVVQKLVARPFFYMWMEPCSAIVKIGDMDEKELTGPCLHEFHFVNPS
jgi:hypothetical protein